MKPGVCCLFFLAALFSQQPVPSQIKPEDLCTVEGQVLNRATGAPVRKAEVVVHSREGPAVGSAVTDANGNFIIKDIEAGRYGLSVSRTGFVSKGSDTTISLDPGQRLKDLVLRLTPQAVISGRIVDENNEPVVFAQVRAMRYGYNIGRKELIPEQTAEANDLGEYRIYGLSPGRYYVTASFEDETEDDEVDGSAARVSESYVTTYYPDVPDPAVAAALDVGAGAQLRGIDLTLVKARTFRVRGRVRGSENVTVHLVPPGQALWMSPNGDTAAASDGSFEISRVLPGAYALAAEATVGEETYFAHQKVDVAEKDVEKIVLTLAPGAEVRGRFVVEGDAQLNLDALQMYLRPRQQMGARGYEYHIHDGAFVISDIGPDFYTLQIANLPDGYWVKSIRTDDQEVKDTGIDLTRGPGAPLTVILAPNAGQIDGVALNDEQHPAPAGTVVLVPAPRLRDHLDLYKTATSDQNGRFSFRSIEPGDYKLFAWADMEGSGYMDPDVLRLVEDRGQAISIHAGSRESVQVAIIPAGSTGRKQ